MTLENLTLDALEREVLTVMTLGDFTGATQIQISYDLVLGGPSPGLEQEQEETFSLFRYHTKKNNNNNNYPLK